MQQDTNRHGLLILSGGQTGVDRAALDAALAEGLPCGGWCPRGRWAEDGLIATRYPLAETPLADPAQRTQWNVRDADGTLILVRGPVAGGTALMLQCASDLAKPCLVHDLRQPWDTSAVLQWLAGHRIAVLNIAGPRESEAPGIQAEALPLILELFRQTRPRRFSQDAP